MHLWDPHRTSRLSKTVLSGYLGRSALRPFWPSTLRQAPAWMLSLLCSALLACSGTSAVVGPDTQDPQGVAAIEVEPSSVQLTVGDTARLNLKGNDGNGNTVSVKNKNVRWTSSDTTVASVDSTGLVRTRGDGLARIDVELTNPGNGGPPPRDSARVRGVAAGGSDGSGQGGGGSESGDDGDDGNDGTSGDSGDDGDDGTSGDSEDEEDDGTSDDAGSPDAHDDFRAFPEAEGYGAEALTTCDRSDVQLLRVTNLEDSGSGSLRDALGSVKNNVLSVVVFDVAGYIDVGSRIDVRSNCLYVAGQTAPGDGITIRARGTGLVLRGGVRDVVIRHLRLRGGYHGDNRGHNNLIIGSGHDIVLDHLSLGWTTNYLLSITQYDETWSTPIYNISVQRSLIHEPLAAHPTAIQISDQDRADPKLSQIALHHNLMANNHHRNPNSFTSGLQVINNVVYNWGQGAGQGEHKAVTDWIGNYFKAGPMTSYPYEITHFISSKYADPSYYVTGNVGPHNDDPQAGPDAQWEGPNRVVACYYKCDGYGDGSSGQPLPDEARRDAPLSRAPIPVTIDLATDAFQSVLQDVGANARSSCRGGWLSNSDQVDRRVIANVENGTGPGRPPETEEDVGGFPSISGGVPCEDSDGDGMPDEFEERFGFDPSDPADASRDADGDGYSNLEEYLNGSAPM